MKRALFLLLFLIACSPPAPAVVFDGGSFAVELAVTPEEKAQGLMFRDAMPRKQGMLFIFDDEQPRTFWMKNTFIPLDMIFLDKSLVVVDVKHDVQPCINEPCQQYTSKPAMYVLEINGGLAKEKGIVVGSQLALRE